MPSDDEPLCPWDPTLTPEKIEKMLEDPESYSTTAQLFRKLENDDRLRRHRAAATGRRAARVREWPFCRRVRGGLAQRTTGASVPPAPVVRCAEPPRTLLPLRHGLPTVPLLPTEGLLRFRETCGRAGC